VPSTGEEPQIVLNELPETVPRETIGRLAEFEAELRGTIEDVDNAPNGLKLILACLQESDYGALKASFSRWMSQLEPKRGMLSVRTLEALEHIADFLALSE
jgi:hypothetical protein